MLIGGNVDKIDRSKAMPLYQQIADDIKEKIAKKVYRQNEKLPTEYDLQSLYGVSRVTIRKAMELLVDEDVIARRPRAGTFVLPDKVSYNLINDFSFSRANETLGHRVKSELLGASLESAHPSDNDILKLEDNFVIKIKRLRYIDDEPIVLEKLRFSRKFAYLLSEDLTGSIQGILEKNNVYCTQVEKNINVCSATSEEANFLNVEPDQGMLLIKNVYYTSDYEPVYRSKEIINATRFEYKIFLNNTHISR